MTKDERDQGWNQELRVSVYVQNSRAFKRSQLRNSEILLNLAEFIDRLPNFDLTYYGKEYGPITGVTTCQIYLRVYGQSGYELLKLLRDRLVNIEKVDEARIQEVRVAETATNEDYVWQR